MASVYRAMVSAGGGPITRLCHEFGRKKLRDEACSWEAQQLEHHRRSRAREAPDEEPAWA